MKMKHIVTDVDKNVNLTNDQGKANQRGMFKHRILDMISSYKRQIIAKRNRRDTRNQSSIAIKPYNGKNYYCYIQFLESLK